MIKGLMVARYDGSFVYSYLMEYVSEDHQLLMSGFLAALQMFAKGMFSESDSEMRSMTVSTTRYTFRNLRVHGPAREPFDYHFVLMTDTDSKESKDLENILEFIIVNFLGYEQGGFIAKLRIADSSAQTFKPFDEFMAKLMKMGWEAAKKKIKPAPSSVMQGVLNELRDHMPIAQILALHPKITKIGTSYVWVSDDISSEEEEKLGANIKQALFRLFGPGMYESIVDDVKKQFAS